MNKCEYIVDENGIIFRKYKTITKEVPKRLSKRGYLEFKMNGKTVSYKRFVAQKLLPNPNDYDKVFSKNGDQFDTRPENLIWVWTRENRTYTVQEALERTNDKHLIEYYSTGNKREDVNYTGIFQIAFVKIKTEEMILNNPLGIIISQFTITKDLGGQPE